VVRAPSGATGARQAAAAGAPGIAIIGGCVVAQAAASASAANRTGATAGVVRVDVMNGEVVSGEPEQLDQQAAKPAAGANYRT
jgi:hypothetical protein